MAHVFFSYAHNDAKRLYTVHARLQAALGRYLWIDRVGLRQGIEWERAIKRAIDTSYAVIFAITNEFISPKRTFIHEKEIPWVLTQFLNKQGPLMFALRFDDVPLPLSLANLPTYQLHTIDAFALTPEELTTKLAPVLPPETERNPYFVVAFPRLSTFRGRNALLTQIHDALEGGTPVGVKTAGLHGMGGIGKTQLAVEYAHRYQFYYPGGVYWVNAAEPLTRGVVHLAERLGLANPDPTDPDRDKQMVFAFAKHGKDLNDTALLILDNVDDPASVLHSPLTSGYTLQNLCDDIRARLLITARQQNLPGYVPIEVDVLAPDDARQLLLDARPNAAADPTLDEITHALGYLPLALALAAAALSQADELTPAEFLAELRLLGIDEIANTLELGTQRVNVALDWQWRRLASADSELLIALIAAFGKEAQVPIERLRYLVGLSDFPKLRPPFKTALKRLVDLHLVERLDDDTVRLHLLVREYVERKVDTQAILRDSAAQIVVAYRTPQIIANSSTARGFGALVDDLRSVSDALLSPLPELDSLLRLYDLERGNINMLAQSDSLLPTTVIQQLRERAHHHSDVTLRDSCDIWLRSHPHVATHDAYCRPADSALARVLAGHTDLVEAAEWSPDGRLIVSAGSDKTIRVWEAATGTEVRRLEAHTGSIIAAAWSPNGRWIVSAGDDRTVRIWEVATGVEVYRLEGHTDWVVAAIWSPDGRLVASASDDQTVRVWEIATGRQLCCLEGHTSGINAVAWSPDGHWIASASGDRTVRVWDTTKWDEAHCLEGHTSGVTSVAWSPDGNLLVSASSDRTMRVWKVATGMEILCMEGHTNEIRASHWSPDGRWVVSASLDRTVRVWETATGTEIRRLEGHVSGVSAAAWSPNGQWIITAGWDRMLRVWDAQVEGEARQRVGHSREVRATSWSPDGHYIVSASDDKTVRIWDANTNREVRRIAGRSSYISAAWSPDGQWIVGTSNDATVRIWEAATAEEVRRLSRGRGYMNTTWSPDGRWLVSVSSDRSLRVWEVATGKELRRFDAHTGWLSSAAWAPDGRWIASAGGDYSIQIWNSETGEQVAQLKGHIDHINSVAWSPNGHYIVSAGNDKTVRVWEVATGIELARLEGHSDWVNAAIWLQGGRVIVSASDDGTLRVWSPNQNTLLAALRCDDVPRCLGAGSVDNLFVAGFQSGALAILKVHAQPHHEF